MEEKDNFKKWIIAALILVGLGFWWGITAYRKGKLEDAAKFGDSFGAINSICSSMAAAGAVYAVILQRKELRESRKAAEDSAKAQADLVKLQANITIYTDWSKERDLIREKIKEHRHRQAILIARKKRGSFPVGELEEINAELKWLKDAIDEGEKNLEGSFDRLMEARERIHRYLGEENPF